QAALPDLAQFHTNPTRQLGPPRWRVGLVWPTMLPWLRLKCDGIADGPVPPEVPDPPVHPGRSGYARPERDRLLDHRLGRPAVGSGRVRNQPSGRRHGPPVALVCILACRPLAYLWSRED